MASPRDEVARIEAAAKLGDPQKIYDVAREVEDGACTDALKRFARGYVLQAEAVDRHEPSTAVAGRRLARRWRATALNGFNCGSASGAAFFPPSALDHSPPRTLDQSVSRELQGAAQGFDGISAVWYQDLRSGTYASYNADMRFPAASTVKLALAVASERRLSGNFYLDDYDIDAMLRWSSNLGANRLLERVGTAKVAYELRRMGATHSTYPGPYRVGTSLSSRVTTARDLGRMLWWLQAHRQWRIIDGLLESEPFRDNIGLFKPWLPKTWPIAQKNGWISDARHTAAIVYTPTGPRILVVLTYADGLTLKAAQAYARRVIGLTLR